MTEPRIQTLIVDDEPDARALLEQRLKDEPDFELVGVCASGKEALSLIIKTRPDLLLLDIHMPGLSGLELLEHLSDRPTPYVIFSTAFDQYAVRAFEYAALDYLLKPFSKARFQAALDRVRKAFHQDKGESSRPRQQNLRRLYEYLDLTADSKSPAPEGLRQFVVDTKRGLQRIAVAEVDAVEAADHYTHLHADGKTFFYQQSLGELEQRLDPVRFVRIHRSAIVHLEAVQSVATGSLGSLTVILRDKSRWKVSRGRRPAFETALLRYNERHRRP